LAIRVPKITTFSKEVLTKQVGTFFGTPCISYAIKSQLNHIQTAMKHKKCPRPQTK